MDINPILTDLKAELNRINQAIAALESLDGTATATTPAAKAAPNRGGRRKGISAAGRKRISEAAKARWAARRKQVAKPASKKTTGRRTVSAASRKKMAEAQRKRWAAQKKAATAVKATSAKKAAPVRKAMFPAARKRLSVLAKARWAARKKAATTAA
jgi:hypothetical protein